MNFIKWLIQKHVNKNNLKPKKKKTMNLNKETFVATPDEAGGGEPNALDVNKTLIITQLTPTVNNPELFQDAKTIKDVFEHFEPEVEVKFNDENGMPVPEILKFREMKDFDVNNGKGQLVQNSNFLMNVKSNIEANTKMKKQIETNKRLRDVLNSTEDKESLKAALQTILDELNATIN
jgi:hypothetical protein